MPRIKLHLIVPCDVVIEVIKGGKAKQDKALEGNGVQFGSVDREFLGDEFDNIC